MLEGTMPNVDENIVFQSLLKYRLQESVTTENVTVNLQLRPKNNHVGDSPDFILWLDVEFELFGQNVKVEVPIPVEAEKGGILGGALDDLRKFVDRRKHLIQVPMIVVAEQGFRTKEQTEQFPTRFTITQIPIRRI
jgi:hypothetical protein